MSNILRELRVVSAEYDMGERPPGDYVLLAVNQYFYCAFMQEDHWKVFYEEGYEEWREVGQCETLYAAISLISADVEFLRNIFGDERRP